MPIRIDYSPVGTLMNLARSAGEAQEAQASSTHDLAFTQMAMQAQTQNAQIAATIQRNNQAFQLQQAAIARQTRTPTRAGAGVGPVAQEVDQVLQRQAITRGWEQQDIVAKRGREQQDIAAQMEQLERIPGLSARQTESARLQIMAGQPLAQILKEQRPEQVGLTPAQMETRTGQIYRQARGDLEAERERLLEEKQFQGWTHTPAWQEHLDTVVSRIQTLDAKFGTAGGAAMDPKAVGGGGATQPWPASKAEAVPGTVYTAPNGKLVRWDGSKMIEVGR